MSFTTKNTFFDYNDYLSKKSAVNKNDGLNYSYIRCYNKAIQIKDTNPTDAVNILIKLYQIKKDPDVLSLLQSLQASNPNC